MYSVMFSDDILLHTVPIHEGFACITPSIVSAAAEKEIVRVVLEKLYNMRFDSDTELKSTDNKKTCELPDGIIIPVDAERVHRVDMLFQPNFIS